jgi:hypothetical protein
MPDRQALRARPSRGVGTEMEAVLVAAGFTHSDDQADGKP